MRRLYLSLIALFVAVTAMAQSITTTFDFTQNPFSVSAEGKDTTSFTLEQDGVQLIIDTLYKSSPIKISPQFINTEGFTKNITLKLNESGFITKVQFYGHNGEAGIRPEYPYIEALFDAPGANGRRLGKHALWEGVKEDALYFSSGNPVELTKIEVTYTTSTQRPTTYTPTFSLEEGKYRGEQTLTLSAPPNTTIYYTDNYNDLPTRHSTPYTEPIKLNQERVYHITAIVYNENGVAGEAVLKQYSIDMPGVREEVGVLSLKDFTIETEYQDSIFDVWTQPSNRAFMIARGHVNGKKYATKSALISPVIDLEHYYNLIINFYEAGSGFTDSTHNWVHQHAQIKIREEGGEWEVVPFYGRYIYPAFKEIHSAWYGEPVLEQYKGKKVQIGFFYTSTQEVAGTWGVGGISLIADDSRITAIDTLTPSQPTKQPAQGIYDLSGRRVTKPKRGFYIIDGKKTFIR